MCLVPSWSLPENTHDASDPPISIPYVEEALLYHLDESQVDILVTLVVVNSSALPVNLHLTHRRGVQMQNATESLVTSQGNADIPVLLHALRGKSLPVVNASDNWEVSISPLGREPDNSLLARVPMRELESGDITFLPDVKAAALLDTEQRPFTMCTFGSIPAGPEPVALRVFIRIAEPTFSTLVHKVNQYGWKYYYEIAGPTVVLRDLHCGDIRAVGDESAALYRPILASKVNPAALPIKQYDVVTFDRPTDLYSYTRAMARVDHVIRNVEIGAVRSGGKPCIVNGWRTGASDFLILRTSALQRHE